jgi:hypothetical protein
MFGQSRLFLGLLSEPSEAVAAQVSLWDRSNVWQAAWEQARKSKLATDAGTYLHEKVGEPVNRFQKAVTELIPVTIQLKDRSDHTNDGSGDLDPYVMKFCRLLQQAGLRLDRAPDVATIHDLCLQIERSAVRTLSEVDDRSVIARLKGAPRQGFHGTSTDDLVRYVIQKTFDQLDQEFSNKSLAEQDEIAARISRALHDLPAEEQERIRKAAGLPDLTAETLRQTGRFASLGLGLSGMVGLAGFSAYTTLTSVVAAATGLVGIHLSFFTYHVLVSALAGLSNPLLFIPMMAGGATWMTGKANRSIRGVLYPTLVASSVMSLAASEKAELPIQAFLARIGTLINEIGDGAGPHTASLVSRFPALGNPAFSARLASHVVP